MPARSLSTQSDASASRRACDVAVAFVTMGCARNEVDTAHMRARLAAAGFMLSDNPAKADAVIVNTCSFIQEATEESLEAIFDGAGLDNVASGDAALIVAGCMPSRYGEGLAAELTEARAFVPCSREDDIAAIVAETCGFELQPVCDPPKSVAAAVDATDDRPGPVSAYVKISDGCDRFCSYCTIPFIRGRYRSFPLADIVAEIDAYVAAGVREIVLIAQDTGRWGTDFDEPSSLAALTSAVAEAHPNTWFRLMYIQPEGITDDLIEAVATHANVCNYFDIPLQHVDKDILQAMNRSGSRGEFLALIKRIRDRLPTATLRTTLIAGFPGETDSQFDDVCAFVEEAEFDYVGVFAYSREEGTSAYKMPGQVDENEKRERASRLRDVADAVCASRIAARIGQTFDVLIEGCEEDGQLFGRAMCQAPDVDGVVYVDEGEIGEVRSVTIADTLLYEMEGA